MKKIILSIITGLSTVQILLASLMITRMTKGEVILTIISLIWLVLFIIVNDNHTSKLHKIRKGICKNCQ